MTREFVVRDTRFGWYRRATQAFAKPMVFLFACMFVLLFVFSKESKADCRNLTFYDWVCDGDSPVITYTFPSINPDDPRAFSVTVEGLTSNIEQFDVKNKASDDPDSKQGFDAGEIVVDVAAEPFGFSGAGPVIVESLGGDGENGKSRSSAIGNATGGDGGNGGAGAAVDVTWTSGFVDPLSGPGLGHGLNRFEPEPDGCEL